MRHNLMSENLNQIAKNYVAIENLETLENVNIVNNTV